MDIKRFWINGLVVIILGSVFLGCYYYIKSVQASLQAQSVEQALEIISQGGRAFETYIEIEQERVRGLANKISELEFHEENKILDNLNLLGGRTADYTAVDLDHGFMYSNRLGNRRPLNMEELAFYHTFSGEGVKENYLDFYDGQNTLGAYECFLFVDGVRGLMQKGERISELSKKLSISFYDDSGFFYTTDQKGEVPIHPYQKNSNRTFLNIFDTIVEENNEEDIQVFKESLSKGHSGVIQFSFSGVKSVVTFSPIKVVDSWYIISVIPSNVIMKYTNHILQSFQIFIFVVFTVLVIGFIFLLLERHSHKRTERKEQDI